MKKEKIPSDVDEFLAAHGNHRLVWSFSREAVAIILARIEEVEDANPNSVYNWQDFFTNSQELWSEGVIALPRETLTLEARDISDLEEIKHLKTRKLRCSELIYKTAVNIANKNGFVELSNARFLV